MIPAAEPSVKSGAFRPDLDVQVVSYGLLGMLNWLYKWYDSRGRLGVREDAEPLAGPTAAASNAPPARKRPH